jgi:DNA-directed RNA polymerase specialized sigma24 family protein
VTDHAAPEPDPEVGAAQQLEELLLDRTFDGIVRVVQSYHPGTPTARVQDAVCVVVSRLVRNNHGPKDNIFQYLVNGARRELTDMYRREQGKETVALNEAQPLYDSPAPYTAEPGYRLVATESGRQALAFLLAILKTWDNEGLALVTELYLRAAIDDVPLSPQEAAELASGVLDRDIRPATASVWKHRGFARLGREIDPQNPHFAEEDDL